VTTEYAVSSANCTQIVHRFFAVDEIM